MKVIPYKSVPLEQVEMEGSLGVGVRVLLGLGDGAPTFTLRHFEIAPGGHSPRHCHAHEHEVIIEGGEGTLWTAAGEQPLAAGVVALVPPGAEHQFRAGPAGLRFYCIVPHHGHAPTAGACGR